MPTLIVVLREWFNQNAEAAIAIVAAFGSWVFNIVTLIRQAKATRIDPKRFVSIDRTDGTRRLRIASTNSSSHEFFYHSIRRASPFWWVLRPCMARHMRRGLVPQDTSSLKRKIIFEPPVGNIGLNHEIILLCPKIPSKFKLIVRFAEFTNNTRIRKHKIMAR